MQRSLGEAECGSVAGPPSGPKPCLISSATNTVASATLPASSTPTVRSSA